MDFEGYVDRIEVHCERLGVSAGPSEQRFIDAWNNQIPAKKIAQTFARPHPPDQSDGGTEEDPSPNSKDRGSPSMEV